METAYIDIISKLRTLPVNSIHAMAREYKIPTTNNSNDTLWLLALAIANSKRQRAAMALGYERTIGIPMKFNAEVDEQMINVTFRVTHELGAGAAGTVWVAEPKYKNWLKPVALKVIRMSSEGAEADANVEIKTLQELSYYGTNCYKGANCLITEYQEENDKVLVLEYLSGVPLQVFIFGNKDHDILPQVSCISATDKIYYIREMIDILEHMHDLGIVHKDIKPDNMIIDTAARNIKFIDFGLSCLCSDPNITDDCNNYYYNRCAPDVGTPQYIDWHNQMRSAGIREQAENLHFYKTADVYALGIVIYEFITGKPLTHLPERLLWMGKHYQNINTMNLSGSDLPQMQEILYHMISNNLEHRWTIQQVRHEFDKVYGTGPVGRRLWEGLTPSMRGAWIFPEEFE